MKAKSLRSSGFTIIELMIATAVFSVVLLVIMTAIVQMGRLYYKANTMSRVQEATRSITDDITRAIQYSPAQVVTHLTTPSDPLARSMCVGSRRFSFVPGRQLLASAPTQHALVSDIVAGNCTTALNMSGTTLSGTEKELLNDKMRIIKLDVQPARNGSSSAFRVTVRVLYGDSDLVCNNAETNTANASHCSNTSDWTSANIQSLARSQASVVGSAVVVPSTIQCKNIRSGSEFCAVAELSTIVERRLQ